MIREWIYVMISNAIISYEMISILIAGEGGLKVQGLAC